MKFLSQVVFSFISFYLSTASFGQILVLEFDLPNEEIPHVDLVNSVACANPELECRLFYSDAFNTEVIESFGEEIKHSKVVNMSFVFDEPKLNMSPSVGTGFDYDQQRKDFLEVKSSLSKVMSEHENVLFSIAAGNGIGASGPMTTGAPLGYFNKLYPAVYDLDNIMVVSAIETEEIELDKLKTYVVASYANYSLFEVDIITSVAKWTDGKLLRGTSFAAPHATRIAADIRMKNPALTAVQTKEIMMKSSYVQNIDKAIEVSKDWNENGRKSLAFKIHTAYRKKNRDNLIKSLGGVMLVKSGGPLIEDVAYQCADNFRKASGMLSITQACLQAHEDRLFSSKERQKKLKKFWRLRQI